MRQLSISIVLSLVFSSSLLFTYAQSTTVRDKDLTWRANELTDKSDSKTISKQHRLVTHGQSSMELHRGTEQTLTFTILSVTGSWSDEKTDGMLEYNVRSSNGVLGKVTLRRNGGTVKAWIDFTQSNKNGLNIELIINTIE